MSSNTTTGNKIPSTLNYKPTGMDSNSSRRLLASSETPGPIHSKAHPGGLAYNRVSTVIIHHGISTSVEIFDLFRKNCRIIRPAHRFYPMGVQVLKLEITPKFANGGSEGDSHYSIFLADEFAAELNSILRMVSGSAGEPNPELRKEYLGLFPLVANDRGLFTVSIDVLPGGINKDTCSVTKNKFLATARALTEYEPVRPLCVEFEFEP